MEGDDVHLKSWLVSTCHGSDEKRRKRWPVIL